MLSNVRQERILQLLVILDLLSGQISCSAELSMKNVLYLVAWSRVEVTNYHYENKYIENFTVKKGRFSDKKKKKKSDIFQISAQSIDCGC